MNRLQGFLAPLRGVQELRYYALDEGDGNAVVIEYPALGLGVLCAECVTASIPALHEVIGAERVSKQLPGVAFEFAENLRGELVVLLAQRGDPRFKRQWIPVAQVSREVYEFFSRALADFGFDTS